MLLVLSLRTSLSLIDFQIRPGPGDDWALLPPPPPENLEFHKLVVVFTISKTSLSFFWVFQFGDVSFAISYLSDLLCFASFDGLSVFKQPGCPEAIEASEICSGEASKLRPRRCTHFGLKSASQPSIIFSRPIRI